MKHTIEINGWLTVQIRISNKNLLVMLFCLEWTKFQNSSWTKHGVMDLNNLHSLIIIIKKYSDARVHLECIVKGKTFGQIRIEHLVDKNSRHNLLHNEKVKKNRDLMKRFIDTVCFLREHELFRGHNENESSDPSMMKPWNSI